MKNLKKKNKPKILCRILFFLIFIFFASNVVYSQQEATSDTNLNLSEDNTKDTIKESEVSNEPADHSNNDDTSTSDEASSVEKLNETDPEPINDSEEKLSENSAEILNESDEKKDEPKNNATEDKATKDFKEKVLPPVVPVKKNPKYKPEYQPKKLKKENKADEKETRNTFLKSLIHAPEDPSFLYDNRFIPGLEYGEEFLDTEMEKEVIVEQIEDKKKHYDVSIQLPNLTQTIVAGVIIFLFVLYRIQVRKKKSGYRR